MTHFSRKAQLLLSFWCVSLVQTQFESGRDALSQINQARHAKSPCSDNLYSPQISVSNYLSSRSFAYSTDCPPPQRFSLPLRTTLDVKSFRLPKSVNPIHYNLKICPEIQLLSSFNGSVEIELEVKEATHEITLNVVDLTIKMVSIWLHNSKHDGTDTNLSGKYNFWPSRNNLRRRKNSKFNSFDTSHNREANSLNINASHPKFRFLYKNYIVPLFKEDIIKVKKLTITFLDIDPLLQRLTIKTKEKLNPKNIYKLNIEFSGYVSNGLKGLYRTYHFDSQFQLRTSLLTQFQASEARRVFPCFDEPEFKASFGLTICRNQNFQTISNMPKESTFAKEEEPGMVWDSFQVTVPMSTYLVAFAILDDYHHMDCNSPSLPFKVWVPANALNHTEFACEVAPPMLDYFTDYFQIPYPLPKMDFLGVRDFTAFGMENWGLVTYRMDKLVVENDSPGAISSQLGVLEIVSHELVHQWFGNLVTPSWWSDIWLNEGFATFLSLFGIDYIRPSIKKIDEFVIMTLRPILLRDSLESTHPVSVSVNDPYNFLSLFDDLSYTKGCFVVRMMMHILTERAFRSGIQTFLTERAYKSASHKDLWHYLTESGHDSGTLWKNLSIETIMDDWILQEGYPVVNVTLLDDGKLLVTQERFYQEDDERQAAFERNRAIGCDGPKWWIPLSLTSYLNPNMSDTSPKIWLKDRSTILDPFAPTKDWFLLNVRQTGFFRVNYYKKNWILLSHQLQDNHLVFDDITRAQLIDDSYTLASSGLIDCEVPLEMTLYLKNEKSPYVIIPALKNIEPILDLYTDHALYGYFKDLLLSSFTPSYPPGGIRNRSYSSTFVRHSENLVINTICMLYEPCIEESKQVFQEWTKNPHLKSIVDKDIFQTVICTAIAEGGQREWDATLRIFMDPSYFDKVPLLLFLSCSRQLWLSNRLLLILSLDSNSLVSRNNFPLALSAVARNPASFPMAWDYLLQIWPMIVHSAYESQFLQAILPHIRTSSQYQEVVDFLGVSMLGGNEYSSQPYLRETLLKVQRKIKLKNRCAKTILNWFIQKYQDQISLNYPRYYDTSYVPSNK